MDRGPCVDWRAKVDLFEQLRREHEFGIGTIAGVAAKFCVHRRMVRQALAGALPPPHRYPPRAKPKLGVVADFVERGHLLPCAVEGLDLAETVFPVVDKHGCITVKTNFYSVPARAGSRVEARIHPLHVEIWHAGRLIARHERCHSRRQHVLDLEHYRDVLSQKPGAFAGPKPLAQWRAAGRWPTCYDELWAQLSKRHGKQNGTRAMIAVLALGQ